MFISSQNNESQTKHEVESRVEQGTLRNKSVVIVSAPAEPEGPPAERAAVEPGAGEVADEPREGAAAAVVVAGTDEAGAEAAEALGGLLAAAELGALREGLARLGDGLERSLAALLATCE